MGKYIEREAAKKLHCRLCAIDGICNRPDCTELKWFDIIPEGDAKPVVRGEWIHHKGGYSDHYECTVCKKAIVLTGRWNFCPNCGADMRGKDTNVPAAEG